MQHKVGEKTKCTVVRVLPSGVSVKLSDGSKGWIRKRDISWFHDVRPTSSFVQTGQEIDAVVIGSDEKTNFLYLSLREVDNPYPNPL
jgi:ribosomal protein S1